MKTTRLYKGWFFLLAASAVGTWRCPEVVAATEEQPPPRVELGDNVCGPRCVRFILERYDKKVDVLTLVRETQWPRREEGASLGALQQALEDRGIHTSALRIGPNTKCDWPTPVLAHLTTDGDQGGHYVVLLPGAQGGKTRVWDGLRGTADRSTWQLYAEMSGFILLTSTEPIVAPERALQGKSWFSMGLILATCAGLCIAFLVVGTCRARRVKFLGHFAPHSKGVMSHGYTNYPGGSVDDWLARRGAVLGATIRPPVASAGGSGTGGYPRWTRSDKL